MADSLMSLKELLAFQPNAPVTPTAAPMAQVTPQLSPTARYIADMQALMQGGIGKLSTGEKLGAVGALLQAAGSRGKVNPADVIGKVREQQMQKLNAQYQIAQLQQKAQQDAQKRAFINQYASSVSEDKRGLLENADLDKAFDIVEKELTAKKQLFQIVNGPAGNKVAVFSDNSRVETDLPNNIDTDLVDRGSEKLLINKDTGEVIQRFTKDLSPYAVARGRPSGRATPRGPAPAKTPKPPKAAAVPNAIVDVINKRLGGVK